MVWLVVDCASREWKQRQPDDNNSNAMQRLLCCQRAATRTATQRRYHGAGNASSGGGTVFVFVFVPLRYGVMLSPLFWPWILA
jgi:hypothetical protein